MIYCIIIVAIIVFLSLFAACSANIPPNYYKLFYNELYMKKKRSDDWIGRVKTWKWKRNFGERRKKWQFREKQKQFNSIRLRAYAWEDERSMLR